MKIFRILLSLMLLIIGTASTQAINFTDQSRIPQWALPAIIKLVDTGVLSGNDDGSFAPERPVNRAEFCKLMVNATGVKKFVPLQSSFSDIETDDWFFIYVETAKYHGWLDGYPDGTFRPGNKINRAEVAKILVNAFALTIPQTPNTAPWFEPYFRALMGFDLFAYGSSWEHIEPEVYPSRAEIAEQLLRFMLIKGEMSLFELETLLKDGVETIYESPPNPNSFLSPSNLNNSTTAIKNNPTIPNYNAPPVPPSNIPLKSSAGSLYVEKSGSLPKKQTVRPGQKNITAHALQFYSKNGNVEMGTLQLRRVGSGKYSDFASIWAEANGKVVSEKVTPTDNIVTIPMKNNFDITPSKTTIFIKLDMTPGAGYGSARLVLFLPEWIEADTKKKVGFFPLGGGDIIIPDPNE